MLLNISLLLNIKTTGSSVRPAVDWDCYNVMLLRTLEYCKIVNDANVQINCMCTYILVTVEHIGNKVPYFGLTSFCSSVLFVFDNYVMMLS